MKIYPPFDGAEFERVVSDLPVEECKALAQRLEAEDPVIRFFLVRDEHWIPTIQRFTLLIHREDRARASPSLDEVFKASSPPSSHTRGGRIERCVTALVRQYARAQMAGDSLAVSVAEGDLGQKLEWLIAELLGEESFSNSSDMWLDGIKPQSVTIQPPFGITILGEIYCGRASIATSHEEPFAAELETSLNAPALDSLVVRFGRLEQLITARMLQAGQPELQLGAEKEFRLRSGVPHAYFDGPPLIWAIELVKGASGS